MSKEFSFFLSLTSFYPLIAAVEDYFYNKSHSMKHTQTALGRNPLEERSARRRDLYLTINESLKIHTSISACRRI